MFRARQTESTRGSWSWSCNAWLFLLGTCISLGASTNGRLPAAGIRIWCLELDLVELEEVLAAAHSSEDGTT